MDVGCPVTGSLGLHKLQLGFLHLHNQQVKQYRSSKLPGRDADQLKMRYVLGRKCSTTLQ